MRVLLSWLGEMVDLPDDADEVARRLTAAGLEIEAIERMERNRRKAIGVLPVVDEQERMQGLLRLHDLVQAGLA